MDDDEGGMIDDGYLNVVDPETVPAKKNKGTVRLSKLISNLGLLSRREVDSILLKGPRSKTRILVSGEDVTNSGVGYKVPANTTSVSVGRLKEKGEMSDVMNPGGLEVESGFDDWESRRRETIVINKPLGYVTGAMEPAPRRSTWTVKTGTDERGREFHAYRPLWSLVNSSSYYHGKTHEDPPTDSMVKRMMGKSDGKGMAPAGRLDVNSSGLVIFTRDGVMARRLVGEESEVEKEVREHVGEERARKKTKARASANGEWRRSKRRTV